MIQRLRERAFLTVHFFKALFDFGLFTQAGVDAFVRVIIGSIAVIISFGFLLVRVYAQKYHVLAMAPTREPYAQALAADMTLAIALPMWIVALVSVLVSHSLFPDETDFRVLMPQPIRRGLVFSAKLLALALFAGLFTITSHLALTPLVLGISMNHWAIDAPLHSVLAFWAAGVTASAFAVLAIVAANGLLITFTPRASVHLASAAMRSIMLGVLVLALPFVNALPAQGARIAEHSRLFLLAPPAWFMGLQRVLLGYRDAYFLELALLAVVASTSVALIACGSYVILYRRFDRVMLHTFEVSRRRAPWWRLADIPARAAVRDFTAATLRRSALHQGVVVALSACGVALALNGLLRPGPMPWLRGMEMPHREIFGAITGMPLPLVIFLGIAARASLALPIEPKANWVFRLTERDAIRADQLHAAERVITALAVFIPVALIFPAQWAIAGPRAIVASAITAHSGSYGWKRSFATGGGFHSPARTCRASTP